MVGISHPVVDQVSSSRVLGLTGTGKSTVGSLTVSISFPSYRFVSQFISTASGQSFGIGSDVKSCTKVVQSSAPFVVKGRRVVLIDTPGFDDAIKSDFATLNEIVDDLKKRRVVTTVKIKTCLSVLRIKLW